VSAKSGSFAWEGTAIAAAPSSEPARLATHDTALSACRCLCPCSRGCRPPYSRRVQVDTRAAVAAADGWAVALELVVQRTAVRAEVPAYVRVYTE
jgi:hypothetical protein